MKKHTTYITHHNGNRPFHVVVDGTMLTVLRTQPGGKPKHIVTVAFIKLFDGYVSKKDTGSSILALLDHDMYLHVGVHVYTFKPEAPIVEYKSPIGPNDVPYPFARDTHNNAYLMIEGIIDHNNTDDDPYSRYVKFHINACRNGTLQVSDHPEWIWDHNNHIQEKYSRKEFVKANGELLAKRGMSCMQMTCAICMNVVDSTHRGCQQYFREDV